MLFSTEVYLGGLLTDFGGRFAEIIDEDVLFLMNGIRIFVFYRVFLSLLMKLEGGGHQSRFDVCSNFLEMVLVYFRELSFHTLDVN